MKDMSIQPVAAASQQDGWSQRDSSASVQDSAAAAPTLSDYAEEESKSLTEMIKDAQEKAEAHRSALKVTKNSTRYGDAPLEAYARLARAKSVSEVNAASGYARRRIAQLQSKLHVDPENSAKIKAAIQQLQKAVNRGARKKRELTREKIDAQRVARSEEAQRRTETELRRRKVQRAVRESGYLREAEVSSRLADHVTATQVELRQQAQSIGAPVGPAAADYAAQQYTATAAAAAAPAPSAELSLQG